MKCVRVFYLCIAVPALFCLVACSGERREDNVWDQYDIREQLPHDSQIPDSDAQTLQENDPYRQYRYIDNDSYYVPPVIQCGIGDLPACSD